MNVLSATRRGGGTVRHRTQGTGFTLMELLVVLVLISAMTAYAVPRVTGVISGQALRGSVRELAAGLRLARSEALRRGRVVDFHIDVAGRRFWIPGTAGERTLPGDFRIRLLTARSQLLDDERGYIRFFPDGSSSGGEISVESDRGGKRVVVDWLTGRSQVDDVTQNS